MSNLILSILAIITIHAADPGHAVFGPDAIEWQGHVYTAWRDGIGTGHNIPADAVVWRDGYEVYRVNATGSAYRLRWLFVGQFTDMGDRLVLALHEAYWKSVQVRPGKWEIQFHADPSLLVSEDGLTWRRIPALRYGTYTIFAGAGFQYGGEWLFPAYAGDAWGKKWATVIAWDGASRWRIWAEQKPPTGIWYTEAPIILLPDGSWLRAIRCQRVSAQYTPEWVEVWTSRDGRNWTYLWRSAENVNYPVLFVDSERVLLAVRGFGGASVYVSYDAGRTWSAPKLVEAGASGLRFMRIFGELRAIWHYETGAAIRGGEEVVR